MTERNSESRLTLRAMFFYIAAYGVALGMIACSLRLSPWEPLGIFLSGVGGYAIPFLTGSLVAHAIWGRYRYVAGCAALVASLGLVFLINLLLR